MIDTVILGAGIAGLGAALKASECGLNATIFEARRTTGGLLDNFSIQGFRFDNAVHLSFASEEKVRKIFDQTAYLTHPADSYSIVGGEGEKTINITNQDKFWSLAKYLIVQVD